MGTCDGLVRVQPMDGLWGTPQGPYWQGSMHDVQVSMGIAAGVHHDGLVRVCTLQGPYWQGSMHDVQASMGNAAGVHQFDFWQQGYIYDALVSLGIKAWPGP